MKPRNRNQSSAILVGAVVGILVFGIGVGQASAQAKPSKPLNQARASFNAAMGKALAGRVPALKKLDQRLGREVDGGGLTGEAKAKALNIRYHVRRQLAEFPGAYKTYARRLQALRSVGEHGRANAAFLRDLNRWDRHRSYSHMASICRRVHQELATDQAVDASALYYLAKADYRQPGMLKRAAPLCEAIIENHPDSPWRPKAMRLLANTHFGLGHHKEALATLSLLQQQYPGTKLAQYADMRRAAVWEYGRGDPQKALKIYQQTLKNYPDHMYGHYIHRQIDRLRGVIEKQLIDDALKDLGRAKGHEDAPQARAPMVQPHQHNPIIGADQPLPKMARQG